MAKEASQTSFRSYLFFWSGQLVSLLGSSIAQFVIVWWITLETGSALFLAISSFAGFAPMVFLMPFAGVLVDRWNRKALIGMVDLLQAIATVALILLFWLNIASIWHVIAVSALRGVFQALHFPATSAIVPLLVPREKLSRINGLNFFFNGAVNIIGPVAASLLLEIWEIHQILWIDAGTFVVAIVPLLLSAVPSLKKKQEHKPSFRTELVEGLTFIRGTRGFLSLLVTSAAVSPLLTPLFTLLPYFVKFDHLGDAADLAFVMAFLNGGMLAGGLLMSVIKGFRRKMVVGIVAAYVIFLGYAIVALSPQGMFWFMAIGALIMTFAIPLVDVSVQTIIQTVVPMEMLGRVNSVAMALSSAARPLSMIISGATVELTGSVSFFLGCVALGIIGLTLSWLFTDIKHVEETGIRNSQAEDEANVLEND